MEIKRSSHCVDRNYLVNNLTHKEDHNGSKEDKAGWLQFLRHLKSRGLKEQRLIISDKCLGLVEVLGEIYPNSDWQRCMVHFYRNVLGTVPWRHMRNVAAMLKAIHAQEKVEEARKKARTVVEELRKM